MVYPLAFPLKSIFGSVKERMATSSLIEASWEKETREALQDVSGGDDDDANGSDDDPGGNDPHSGGGSTKDRSKEIKDRFGIDDTFGDVDAAVEGDVKSTEPTAKPDKKSPEQKKVVHKGAQGEIPMPAGLEPGYHRWSRRDEKAIVFQTTNAKGGPKWKDVVGNTTVNSDTYFLASALILKREKNRSIEACHVPPNFYLTHDSPSDEQGT